MNVDASIIARYERLYSSIVSDSIEALGHPARCLAPDVKPYHTDPLKVVVGPAWPSLCVKTSQRVEIDMLLELVDTTPDGSVIVVAADQEIDGALWGGLMSSGVKAKGSVGAVVDGGVRDLHQIVPLGYPVFARYRCPLDIRGRAEMVSVGEPVVCRGVPVKPGELVFADANGVVVVPEGAELEVLDLCEERVGREDATQRDLQAGRGVKDTYSEYEAI